MLSDLHFLYWFDEVSELFIQESDLFIHIHNLPLPTMDRPVDWHKVTSFISLSVIFSV